MRNCSNTSQTTSFEVFDRNIPTDFLDSQSEVLNTYISQIEQDVSSQEELDNIYSHLMRSIKEEMVQSLSQNSYSKVRQLKPEAKDQETLVDYTSDWVMEWPMWCWESHA